MGLIELVRDINSGDDPRAAEGLLYKELELYLLPRIQASITSRVRPRLGARDVFHRAFERAMRSLSTFRGSTEGEFRSWFKQIVRHLIVDDGKRMSANMGRFATGDDRQGLRASRVISPLPGPDEASEVMDSLRKALGRLRPEEQTLIRLREIEGKSFEEIAAILGKSAAAVQRAHHRAYERLGAVKPDRSDV